MSRKFFITLPVADLAKSKAFFAALGFEFDAQCSGDEGAGVVVSDDVRVMLVTQAQFAQLSPLPMSDAWKTKEMLLCLSCESRAEVDALAAKALAAGGTTPNAAEDHGFMYDHGFVDLDGHAWGLAWFAPTSAE